MKKKRVKLKIGNIIIFIGIIIAIGFIVFTGIGSLVKKMSNPKEKVYLASITNAVQLYTTDFVEAETLPRGTEVTLFERTVKKEEDPTEYNRIEYKDKNVTYFALGDKIIYDLDKDFDILAAKLLSNSDKKIGLVFFEQIPSYLCEKLKNFTNVVPMKPDVSPSFKDSLDGVVKIVTFVSIGKTSSKQYKLIKEMLLDLNKDILYDVLV